MKKNIVIVGLLVCSLSGWSQELSSGVQFHSVSFSLGVSNNQDITAISGSLDLGVNFEKHIIKAVVLASTSSKGGPYPGPPEEQIRTEEYDLLYGREFEIFRNVFVDGYAGVGLFVYEQGKRNRGTHVQNNTIGFPILARGRFQAGRLIGLGLQLHTNINSVQSVFGGGFFLQFKFNK